MLTETKPLAEITQEAVQILFREIGVANTVRFMNQFTMGHGDYTQERDELFNDQELNDLIRKIKQQREK